MCVSLSNNGVKDIIAKKLNDKIMKRNITLYYMKYITIIVHTLKEICGKLFPNRDSNLYVSVDI